VSKFVQLYCNGENLISDNNMVATKLIPTDVNPLTQIQCKQSNLKDKQSTRRTSKRNKKATHIMSNDFLW
jgi:hypothetical protein